MVFVADFIQASLKFVRKSTRSNGVSIGVRWVKVHTRFYCIILMSETDLPLEYCLEPSKTI